MKQVIVLIATIILGLAIATIIIGFNDTMEKPANSAKDKIEKEMVIVTSTMDIPKHIIT